MNDRRLANSADNQEEYETVDVTVDRQCLRCRSTFLSGWVGERICSRCKTSSTWKQGHAINTHPTGGSRR